MNNNVAIALHMTTLRCCKIFDNFSSVHAYCKNYLSVLSDRNSILLNAIYAA